MDSLFSYPIAVLPYTNSPPSSILFFFWVDKCGVFLPIRGVWALKFLLFVAVILVVLCYLLGTLNVRVIGLASRT